MTDKKHEKGIISKAIDAYIKNRTFKQNLHGIYNDKGGFYVVKGELIPSWIVEAAYPDTLLKNRVRQDPTPDGRAVN